MEVRLVKLLDSQHKAQLAQHSLTRERVTAAVAGSLQVSLAASRREHQAARDEAQRQHEADMRSAR